MSRYLDSNLLTIGRKYAIEMTMVEPDEDYSLFVDNIPQLLINLNLKSGVPGADQIQELGSLTEFSGLNFIKGFGGLSSGDWKQQLDAAIAEISRSRNTRHWPAYFKKTCLGKSGICFNRRQVKYFKKIGAKFTLGKMMDGENHELQNLSIYHSDPVNGYQEFENAVFPTIECSTQVSP